jgi:hypothetical protein
MDIANRLFVLLVGAAVIYYLAGVALVAIGGAGWLAHKARILAALALGLVAYWLD